MAETTGDSGAAQSYKRMFEAAVSVLAEIDEILGIEADGCNDPQATVSALKDVMANRRVSARGISDEEIDLIAADGMRNAAGGIYKTRVHEFARAVAAAALAPPGAGEQP